ncbi:MAG TPA: hypothetical protein ENI74_06820 [Gammaproteobacteria bacterium]|nr:hypothetical protein [Gammaproteobacteria bacterium]
MRSVRRNITLAGSVVSFAGAVSLTLDGVPVALTGPPAWQGTARQAIRAAGYPQNYNNSEAIARRSSAGLAQLLDTGFADYSQI